MLLHFLLVFSLQFSVVIRMMFVGSNNFVSHLFFSFSFFMFHSKQNNVWALIKEILYCNGHNLQLRSSRNCVFRSRCPYYCHFLNLNFSLICQFAPALKLNKLSYICMLGDYFRKYRYLRMYLRHAGVKIANVVVLWPIYQ